MTKNYAKVGEHLEYTYMQNETNREVEYNFKQLNKLV